MKEEIKHLRQLLETGQKMAISTKDFEKVLDNYEELEQENALLKEQLLTKSEQEQSFQSLLEDNAKLKDENRKLANELVKHLSSGTIAKINAHKYVNVLQEINLIIDELKQQYDYMEDYSEIKEIEKKIKEVLA